ncbi:type II secretion system protein [Acetobacterium sp.]|uniref:type II secretion system protein n=1 Tax=Acetobacterium sp. TaxID=1872094 RepID=UPI002F404127
MKTFKHRFVFYQRGFTLVELMVTLAILSLLTVSVAAIGLGNSQKVSQAAFNAECETILYTLLEHKNEAMMDGHRRQVRFFENGMIVNWTNEEGFQADPISLKTCSLATSYVQTNPLQLKSVGTVSMGGTVKLTSHAGAVRIITIQLASGRIYLDEP